MQKLLFLLVLTVMASACQTPVQKKVEVKDLKQMVHEGHFKKASSMIDSLVKSGALTGKDSAKAVYLKDLMHRIKLDFSKNEEQVRSELQRYYPSLTDSQMNAWEQTGALEMRRIDGQKRFFRNAVPNLFRIDSAEAKVKLKVDGPAIDATREFCKVYDKKIVEAGKPLTKHFEFTYTITVKPNEVPCGQVVRCWLPFPRISEPRQDDVKLISTSQKDFQLAVNKDNLQRSLYMEQFARQDSPVVFSYKASFDTHTQLVSLNPAEAEPYDTTSALYRNYTAQRLPQIIFSDDIRKLTNQIVGDETNPIVKARDIFNWIDSNIPWASALEYSTFDNIPEYVLKYRHGDCGMQTLLFMTMARFAGVPAKWQSGWMIYPVELNLHDWCEVYFEGIGWVPVDPSFGRLNVPQEAVQNFYFGGYDGYRMIVNDGFSQPFTPAKEFPRSEPIDFQRGEVEWSGGNLYFDQWNYHMDIKEVK
ncbi:transglutaminase-like domain-containing protein [Prolixibacter denitrificans]|uniref:Cysteine protease n=1 Tax=Prolixibacter denitrificans TaxID=1541063 RepID=A0A2P8CIP8_9BACT|nr:transglutaminase-like domain-containing protein [Prolixibacter denitrificans]PSK84813.1 transglutaminase superfamily protein [Prolixibacter denitrificans]GET20978.1 cysteine protease [Prolixibacter denitrificans]